MLDERIDRVSPAPQGRHDRLGVGVALDEHAGVDVAGEAWFGARRDRESADEGPAQLQRGGIVSQLAQRLLDRSGHAFLNATGRPGQSPNSAPGRSRSHCSTAACTCSSDHCGCSRRRRVASSARRPRRGRSRCGGAPLVCAPAYAESSEQRAGVAVVVTTAGASRPSGHVPAFATANHSRRPCAAGSPDDSDR